MAEQRDATYAFGHSEEEHRRLTEQSRVVGDLTRALFEDAGIGGSMRVLDVGCGVGDVSAIVGSLLDEGGKVVGVDADESAIADATERMRDDARFEFVQGDLRELSFDEPFDAAVGRFILMYLGSPVDALKDVARHLRRGGTAAFHEYDFSAFPLVSAPLPLWERTADLALETMRRAGIDLQMGMKLYWAFREAGFADPGVRVDVRVASGREHPVYGLYAESVRSLIPHMEEFGIATAAELDCDTLPERLGAEADAAGASTAWVPLVGVWGAKQ